MAANGLKGMLGRHEAFWGGEGERPLKQVTPHVALQERGGIPLADGRRAQEGEYITPGLIDPRRFYGEGGGPRSAQDGDFVAGTAPPGLCWTVESPEWADAFLGVCAEVFIETARRRLEHTPRFEGGYVSGYGIWASGSVVRTQVDNATLLSPRVYRERVLPHDRRVIEAFDYPLIHLHSCCLHVVEDLLKVEALRAIQVSIDYPGGPLASEVMPVFRKILREKPLIVTGPVTGAELRELEALDPPGRLCLRVELVR